MNVQKQALINVKFHNMVQLLLESYSSIKQIIKLVIFNLLKENLHVKQSICLSDLG